MTKGFVIYPFIARLAHLWSQKSHLILEIIMESIMSKEPLIYFMDNPCELQEKVLPHSHKFGECMVNDVIYNGYVSNGYYYVVEKPTVSNIED